MTAQLSFPATVTFLALGEESLPLLKRGVIPLIAAADADLIWAQPQAHRLAPKTKAVTEDDYLQHLQQEYQRLPSNLQSLFTLQEFIRQAEPKRADIESALLSKVVALQQVEHGLVNEWLVQRFWGNPYSPQTWSLTGWNKVWVGVDLRQWPEHLLHQVKYQDALPNSFPERLLIDAVVCKDLQEQRLLLPKAQAEQWVTIAGQRHGLIKLPSKAVHCVLFGATSKVGFVQKFASYWKQDLRYKQKPLARMVLHPHYSHWSFGEL